VIAFDARLLTGVALLDYRDIDAALRKVQRQT
jgi:hypothetical protein